MRATVSLLLPAIFPSWRFFETVAPSPRIEVACTSCDTDERSNWVEFRPRPQRIAPLTYLKRLFWNKTWNETLFLVVCAERLVTEPSTHSVTEIRNCIARDLGPRSGSFRFRIVFVARQNTQLRREIAFVSSHYPFTS